MYVCGWMEILIFDIDGHSKICLSLGLKSANIYCESVWTFIAKQRRFYYLYMTKMVSGFQWVSIMTLLLKTGQKCIKIYFEQNDFGQLETLSKVSFFILVQPIILKWLDQATCLTM